MTCEGRVGISLRGGNAELRVGQRPLPDVEIPATPVRRVGRAHPLRILRAMGNPAMTFNLDSSDKRLRLMVTVEQFSQFLAPTSFPLTLLTKQTVSMPVLGPTPWVDCDMMVMVMIKPKVAI